MNIIWSAANTNTSLPTTIYIDTNVLYEVYANPSSPEAVQYAGFIERAIQCDVALLTSPKVREELGKIIYQNIAQDYATKNGYDKNDWQKFLGQKKVYQKAQDESLRVYAELDNAPHFIDLPYVNDRSFELQWQAIAWGYNLLPADATHVWLAYDAQCNSFLTTDHHFLVLPEVNIFTLNDKALRHRTDIRARLNSFERFGRSIKAIIETYLAKRQMAGAKPDEGEK